jgi:hypothetical protein
MSPELRRQDLVAEQKRSALLPFMVALETSGADSSGLTETVREIYGEVDVRLSEQQVVV